MTGETLVLQAAPFYMDHRIIFFIRIKKTGPQENGLTAHGSLHPARRVHPARVERGELARVRPPLVPRDPLKEVRAIALRGVKR